MDNPTLFRPIADDIYQVRIPLPFALNQVNCYVLRGNDGLTIIDSGLNTAEARAVWRQFFEATQIAPAEVEQIVLTHVHPDHFGLAGWLQEYCQDRTGNMPPVYMSPIEAQLAREFWGAADGFWEAVLTNFWRSCGVMEEMAASLTNSTVKTRQRTFPHPSLVNVIEPGSRVQLGKRFFETFHMPGHSDGQLVFYDASDKLLLSGDHVLLKITPNIGLWPQGARNPLDEYLTSLDELSQLTVRLALPGHRSIISDLSGRIGELKVHHAHRLEQTIAAANPGATVLEVSQHLFPFDKLSVHERRFALAETLAHLEYLRRRERLRCTDDIIWTYRPA